MLWQAFVLVLVVALVIHLAANRVAGSAVCWLWQIVAIKLLLMPLWAVVVPVSWWPAANGSDAVAVTAVPPTEAASPSSIETPQSHRWNSRPQTCMHSCGFLVLAGLADDRLGHRGAAYC